MIATSEQLESIAQLEQGSLTEIPFATLLHAMAVHKMTVLLEIQRRQAQKRIIIEHGVPVDCRSNLVHETLGRYMVSQGKLEQDVFTDAVNESLARGVRFGDILKEKGLITEEELTKVLQQNLAKKLLDGFTWEEGEFHLEYDVLEAEAPLKVNVPQLIVFGVTRFAPQEQVDGASAPLVGKPLALHPAPPYKPDEIKFTPKQTKVIEALRSKSHRIDELAPFADRQ